MTEISPNKYNIEKDFKEKLKIFFMIVRPAMHPPIQGEKVIGVVAYRPEDAMRKAKDEHDAQQGLTIISYGDNVSIVELLSRINVEGVTVAAPIAEVPQMPKFEKAPVMGIEGLKSGLLYILNEKTIEGIEEKDQEDLKRIIGNIK